MSKGIQYLRGVGPARARQLAKLGIHNVGDLVHHYPRTYLNRPRVKINQLANYPDDSVIVAGKIISAPNETRRKVNLLTAVLADETGYVRCVWFNQSYLKAKLLQGVYLEAAGKYSREYGNIVVEDFKIEDELAGILPQYSLTEGISNQVMANLVARALSEYYETELFPDFFRSKYNLLSARDLLGKVHYPKNFDHIRLAQYSIKFTELFLYQLSFLYWRSLRQNQRGYMLSGQETLREELETVFGFRYTPDQGRAISEIEQDLSKPVPMNRLLQGDVGSGKTAVAAHALFTCALNGYKAVIMVPTEVVAQQHFETVKQAAEVLSVPVHLLTGSTKKSQRNQIYSTLAAPGPAILVGTHAVFQEKVQIADLALVITDEQHRFGVGQRLALTEKGMNPHVLVMSATPIPRTLAMTLYGDLDVSTINNKPGGRKLIKTYVVSSSRRKKVFDFISQEMEAGNTGYIICPLIEESESISAQSLDRYQEVLRHNLPQWCRFGLLHGRMSAREKEETISALKNREIHFLLATTVIEVGIDIGNATFIVIENSERFGLAQLHQLRGRVGRREKQSYCFLLTDGQDRKRLEILERTNDGFAVAQEDMRIRGSGQFLGQRQHGINEFKLADIIRDADIARQSRKAATEVLSWLNEDCWSQVKNIVLEKVMNLKS